jgi:hypothetical protein
MGLYWNLRALFLYKLKGVFNDTKASVLYGVDPSLLVVRRIETMLQDDKCPDWLIVIEARECLAEVRQSTACLNRLVESLSDASHTRQGVSDFLDEISTPIEDVGMMTVVVDDN